ncbi:hypothetical protein DBR43_00385 [Pedobacter sp. KBW06]|uniref:DUF1842 domain-containing protein n=1 Tax=Pedobacter sp. KBW06 TaxID=2153359 RepID=UPI000F5AF667|nr:DUF1842 domain-containing protein [Pedobacter sp. KBW06]RQO73901.1 hypothetical protein DBR43_00385 [Pedobacter sp. KBW06]
MLSKSIHAANGSLNFRILSEGLFQPILQLSLTKNSAGSLSGTANLTIKELGRESNLSFKIHGTYKPLLHSTGILISLKGNAFADKGNDDLFSLEMEMNNEWTTGIASYQYQANPAKIIRNATVSSVLFVRTEFKAQDYSFSFY